MSKQIPLTLTPHELAAALAGRLRQIRRPVVPQPHEYATLQYTVQQPARGPSVCGFACVDEAGVHRHDITCRCPFGQPGDVIWGRETWWHGCGTTLLPCGDDVDVWGGKHAYAIDGDQHGWQDSTQRYWWRRRPSIHMPRWASRWARTVAAVRVERVQDMNDDDAIALGVSQCDIPADEDGPRRIGYMFGPDDGVSGLMPTPREAFARHFPEEWEANLWQWVAELGGEG